MALILGAATGLKASSRSPSTVASSSDYIIIIAVVTCIIEEFSRVRC
jgi:hypothetical protein